VHDRELRFGGWDEFAAEVRNSMTSAGIFTRCSILVVEDEHLLAWELEQAIKRVGGIVVGPVANLEQAMEIVAKSKVDGAVVDINLAGEMAFPLADLLMLRHIPFVFATGYDRDIIPAGYRSVARCEKPVNPNDVLDLLAEQGSDRGAFPCGGQLH